MQDYFEKIKERLKKEKIGWLDFIMTDKRYVYAKIGAYDKAIEIVNQVAEEYVSEINVGNNNDWIPCSEKTPEFEKYTITRLWVTMHRKECNFYFVRILRWNGIERKWEWENGKTLSGSYEVVAWRRIDALTPYKPKGEK